MTFLLDKIPQKPWGREYPEYCLSYDDKSVAVPLLPATEPRIRTNALETINLIYMLGQLKTVPSAQDVANRITLSMLMDVFEMTKYPEHLRWLAEPQFVAGCVSLMATLSPSPLQYEYGYICFRILVMALNSCLLKKASYLDETIARMNAASTFQRLPTFWEASAWLAGKTEYGAHNTESVILVQVFEKPVLERLLQVLNSDRKLFLLVLKKSGSLGLSCLMLTLFKRLVGT
ncbi:hypothetical protein FRC11_001348, partial [Ceratobasidium sp. 423]